MSNITRNIKNIKNTKRPMWVINWNTIKMNNVNIKNPEKKYENIKALGKLLENVENLYHRTIAQCYENKTNERSKYYCNKREKLDQIIKKIKEMLKKLQNMNSIPKPQYSNKQMKKIEESIDDLTSINSNVDNRLPNIQKLINILLDTQHSTEEKKNLIWAYINLDEVVLHPNNNAKDMLENLYKCLESSSWC